MTRARVGLAAVIAAVALMAAQTHETRAHPRGYWEFLTDPPRWDGTHTVISIYRVMEILGPNKMIIHRGAATALIEAPTSERVVGEEVTVLGTFRASDQALVADVVETHPWRPWKMASGVVATLLVIGLLPAWFRVSAEGVRPHG